jgi:hypothetical protein
VKAQVRGGNNQSILRLPSLFAPGIVNTPRHCNCNSQAYQRANGLDPGCNVITEQTGNTEKRQSSAARGYRCKAEHNYGKEVLPATIGSPNRFDPVFQSYAPVPWIEEESYLRSARVFANISHIKEHIFASQQGGE